MTTLKKEKYKDGKTLKSFRLNEGTIERLKELSKATGKTMTDVVTELIHSAEVDDELEAEGS